MRIPSNFLNTISNLLIKKVKKFIQLHRKNDVLNSLLSSIFRIFLQFNFFFKNFILIKDNIIIDSIDELWIIRVGYFKRRLYFPHINLDPYLSNKPHVCLNLKKIPFKNETCQEITVRHFLEYVKIKNISRILKSWNKALIPGGILKLIIRLKGNEKNLEILKHKLSKFNFYIDQIDYSYSPIDGTISITNFKQKSLTPNQKSSDNKKIKDIILNLKEHRDLFFNNLNICCIGYNSKKVEEFIRSINLNNKIEHFESIESLKKSQDNHFNLCIISNFFEYILRQNYSVIFDELRRVLKPNASILLIVPEKRHYLEKQIVQYFDKGILAKIIDQNNLEFKWINLNSTMKLINALIINKNEKPEIKNKIKILLLGNYTLRYSNFNMVCWDAQIRGFERLGYNPYILDFKDYSFNFIIKFIKFYKPDILWTAGKIVIDLFIKYSQFFKESSFKVIYWFWDVRTPIKYDFSDIIDIMFISSKGEIPIYKKSYNLKDIYFMPTPITPQLLHRNNYIKEIYDIGFSGRLDMKSAHKERTQHIITLMKHFNVKVVENIHNNITEFYSKCKIIFGGTPNYKDLELYSSFRMYYVLSCGCCYLTSYFKGLERLAENEKHLLFYKNENEMIALVKKYLSNDDFRHKIEEKAKSLIAQNYHYSVRIQNMMDIVEGKANEFNGYIK